MFPAKTTIFIKLDSVRRVFLILHLIVVTLLAFGAGKSNLHTGSLCVCHIATSVFCRKKTQQKNYTPRVPVYLTISADFRQAFSGNVSRFFYPFFGGRPRNLFSRFPLFREEKLSVAAAAAGMKIRDRLVHQKMRTYSFYVEGVARMLIAELLVESRGSFARVKPKNIRVLFLEGAIFRVSRYCSRVAFSSGFGRDRDSSEPIGIFRLEELVGRPYKRRAADYSAVDKGYMDGILVFVPREHRVRRIYASVSENPEPQRIKLLRSDLSDFDHFCLRNGRPAPATIFDYLTYRRLCQVFKPFLSRVAPIFRISSEPQVFSEKKAIK